MKKLTLIAALLFSVSFGYAQKGKVAQANSYFTSGKLDEAKKAIDQAMQHESCQDFTNGFYSKGQIYQAIFESQVPGYKKLDPNALNVAWEAYQKVIELDVKKKFTKKLNTQYKNLIVDFTNKGVECYGANDFKGALAAFEKVLEIRHSNIVTKGEAPVVDTAVIFNAAVVAQKSGELASAEKYYKEALKYNYEPARTYAMLASVLKEQNKTEEYVEYLHKGFELFPNDSYIIVELINYYLTGGEPEKAEKYLDAAIAQDPSNASFYRAKGNLYEKTKQLDKALELYEKALSIDPKDFVAQFNIGNIKLTEVSEFHKTVQDIVDVEEYNKEMEKVYAGYESVIPYFEKAYELNQEEPSTLAILKELYFRLRNRDAKFQKRFDEINALINQQ